VIGRYTADSDGHGHAQGKADDDLDEIHSVSVRLNSDFTLLACAAVNDSSTGRAADHEGAGRCDPPLLLL